MITILKYYGINADDIQTWGGKIGVSIGDALNGDFDIIAGFLASPAMNPYKCIRSSLFNSPNA